MRSYTFALGLFAGLLACMEAPAPASQVAAVQPPATQGMAVLLSARRANSGLGPLAENPRLSAAARTHAADMVRNGFFDHAGSDGTSFVERAERAGYGCARAENIAAGQRGEAEAVAMWMGSPPHRRNILLPDIREFGIGRAETHWVLVLGTGC